MKLATGTELTWRRGTIAAYLRCIRYDDVLVLQGSPVLGALYALDHLTLDAVPRLAVFLAASCLLVAHVFSFNDWAGITADGNDPNKVAHAIVTRGINSRSILILSLALLGASMLLFASLDARTLVLAAGIAALGIAYSHPSLDAKGTPLVASVPHLVGGVLHFLLGYSLFAPIDGRAGLIAVYFALTFTAGHLNQEVRDYDSDRANGIRTTAVRFGQRPVFVASVIVFTLAYAHLGFLAATSRVPAGQAAVLLLLPVHAFWSWRAFRADLTYAAIIRLRTRYRLLYGLIGLILLVTLFVR